MTSLNIFHDYECTINMNVQYEHDIQYNIKMNIQYECTPLNNDQTNKPKIQHNKTLIFKY